VHHATRDLLDEAARLHPALPSGLVHQGLARRAPHGDLTERLFPSARSRDRRLGLTAIGRSLLPRRRFRDRSRKIRSCVTGYGEPAGRHRPPTVVTPRHRWG
jgi:hypothetical protein